MRSLNAAILELAPPHIARPDAPNSFADLMRHGSTLLPVWDGASDLTIYGDAKVNHAFRAWHDACHVQGGFAFDLEGETKACELQKLQLLQRFPNAPAWALDIIHAEVIGQTQHLLKFGVFPLDQKAFHNDSTKRN